MDLLASLQPRREYLRLFEAIVLDTWKDQQAEAIKLTSAIKRSIDQILEKKNRLVDAYVHEGKIDRETYQDQVSRLQEERSYQCKKPPQLERIVMPHGMQSLMFTSALSGASRRYPKGCGASQRYSENPPK
jgi:hypothetical protein